MLGEFTMQEKVRLEKVAKNLSAMLPLEMTCDERREFESKIFLALANAWKRGWKRANEEIGL